ncbi:hypothetical protein AAE478_006567 [Parahypoxylon ruwenzoriense]
MANGKPTLHHLENSQSQLILWLLEELGIEYNLVVHKRGKDMRAPPALKDVHPLGKSPVLVTPRGRVITERAAIALWLINNYDEGARFRIPPSADGGDDAVREEQLISLGGATLNPLIMIKLITTLLVRRAPLPARPLVAAVRWALDRAFLDAELAHVVEYLDSELLLLPGAGGESGDGQGGSREYFMGTKEPTRADFTLLWYVDWGVQGGWVDLEKFPRLKEWYERCTARPAWKTALEKGGGYDLRPQ